MGIMDKVGSVKLGGGNFFPPGFEGNVCIGPVEYGKNASAAMQLKIDLTVESSNRPDCAVGSVRTWYQPHNMSFERAVKEFVLAALGKDPTIPADVDSVPEATIVQVAEAMYQSQALRGRKVFLTTKTKTTKAKTDFTLHAWGPPRAPLPI